MSGEHSPDAILDAIRARQSKVGIGVGAAVAVASLVSLVGFLQMGALAAGVADIQAEATRIDAGREFAHPAFAPASKVRPLIKLGTFVANPPDTAKIRYIRVSVQVAVTGVERMEQLGLNKIRARAEVTKLLSGRTVEELSVAGGQDRARAAIRDAIMSHFPADYLLGVHFTEFVVQ